jgi:hypothetical protein
VASATLGRPDLCGLGHGACSPVKTMSGILDWRRWRPVRHVPAGGVVMGHLHASSTGPALLRVRRAPRLGCAAAVLHVLLSAALGMWLDL